MDNTINGRTPEEIKKGLECCSPRYESEHWVSCSSECPFRNEGAYCRNALHACNKKYIQQLERDLAEAQEENDLNNAAITELEGALGAMKRERDAAVEDIPRACGYCKHSIDYGPSNHPGCKNPECRNISGVNTGWQWRGVQEVQHGTE